MSDVDSTNRPAMGRPISDPSALTTEALARGLVAEREYVIGRVAVIEERLRGIDTATRLLNETVNRTPTEIQKEIAHLRELTELAIKDLGEAFQLQVDATQRAVEAALAAQKELARSQDESNQKAIDKAEKATIDAIEKNATISATERGALAAQLGDLKDRLTAMEQARAGAGAQRQEARQTNAALYGTVGFVISLIIAGIAIVGVLAGTQ